MNKETCGNCRFYIKQFDDCEFDDCEEIGTCHCNSPKPRKEYWEYGPSWPEVMTNEWCGDWEAKNEPG